ncbi:hypothetical protein N9B94_01315 [Verrucomicrobia bacterium]|nr:hypothetical protein [Verrucomicrobiota bacterium]
MVVLMKVISVVLFLYGILYYVIKWSRKEKGDEFDSEVGLSMGSKSIATGIMLGFFSFVIMPVFSAGPSIVGIVGLVVMVITFRIMSALWMPQILDAVLGPMFSIFDGGSQLAEKEPLMGPIRKARSFQRFEEVIELVDEQMEEFPKNYELYYLKAEVLAVNLHRLEDAREAVQEAVEVVEMTEGQIYGSWTALADWEMSVGRDSEMAEVALMKIVEMFPDSTLAEKALTRISRLPTKEAMHEQDHKPDVKIEKTVRDLGLRNKGRNGPDQDRDKTESFEEEIAGLESEVELNPRDEEARTRLAFLYATFYKDFELARVQFDFLINRPNQAWKDKINLLNRFAALQEECGLSVKEVGMTLDEILKIQPSGAQADQVISHMARIGYVPVAE